MFYDDAITLQFLRALRCLMLQYRAKAYVSFERRSVFSALTMQIVSLGYDTFQDHICYHDSSICHSYVSENQVQCQLCTTHGEDSLHFVVHEVETSKIPQRFKYERLSTLMLWMVDAVVI